MSAIYDFVHLKDMLDKDLNWEEGGALCDSLSVDALFSVHLDIIYYYFTMPIEKRFYQYTFVNNMNPDKNMLDWNEWKWAERSADYIMPTQTVFIIAKLLCKAGHECVLTWIQQITCEIEAVAILSCVKTSGENILEMLSLACANEGYAVARNRLLFYIVSNKDLLSKSLLKVIDRHKEVLRLPILNMICDFALPLQFPHSSSVYSALFERYTDVQSLEIIAQKPVCKGTLYVWVTILSALADRTNAHIECFQQAYIQWLITEEKYTISRTTDSNPVDNEWIFVNCLSNMFADNAPYYNQLKKIWERKSERYYGWGNQTTTEHSQWFMHIGLLLWGIGMKHYKDQDDPIFMLDVVRYLNEYIPSALSSSCYYLLLLQIFCSDFKPGQELISCMCALISKIYDMNILCSTAQCYLQTSFQNGEVLKSFKERIHKLYEFINYQKVVNDDQIVQIIQSVDIACNTYV